MQNLRRFTDPRPSEGVAVIVRPQAHARLPLAGGPQLSHAGGQLLRQIRVADEYGDEHAIQVPVERPLSVLIDGRQVPTLWTLGACPEWLVLGYLWNQQLVTDKILYTTTRLSAEIVAKAAYSGVPILISRKGVTATAFDLGEKLGMTLCGHAARGRAGAWRCQRR